MPFAIRPSGDNPQLMQVVNIRTRVAQPRKGQAMVPRPNSKIIPEHKPALPDGAVSDRVLPILDWLAEHPQSTSVQIARAMGYHGKRYMFTVLQHAEQHGLVQRTRIGARGPWLWEAVTA